MVYDADGTRLLRSSTESSTVYIEGHEITANEDGSAISASRSYSFGGVFLAVRTTSALQYVAVDNQGSVQLAVAAGTSTALTTRTYLPFGETRSVSGDSATDHGYVGQIEDDTLSYLNARYYDSGLARFISPDPLYDPDRPNTINPYGYAGNNPSTYSDPTGLIMPDNEKGSLVAAANTYSTVAATTASDVIVPIPASIIDPGDDQLFPNQIETDHIGIVYDMVSEETAVQRLHDGAVACETAGGPTAALCQAWMDLYDDWAGKNYTPERLTREMRTLASNALDPESGDGVHAALTQRVKDFLERGPTDVNVYYGYDENDNVVYVGITNDVARRRGEHRDRFDVRQSNDENALLTRGEARAIEQAVISQYGPMLLNNHNSIAPGRDISSAVLAWGRMWIATGPLSR